jgi:hypothetical protein
MNNYAFPRDEFNAMLAEAVKGQSESRQKLVRFVAQRILVDWDGVSYSSFVQKLTQGQAAVVISARFQEGAAYDFLTMLTSSELPSLALGAFARLSANEYLKLLLEVRAAFPRDEFPKFVETTLHATRKHGIEFFEEAAEKFAAGVKMKRKLEDYAVDYMAANVEEFTTA